MNSRSYIKLTGNLTNITGGTSGGTINISNLEQPQLTRYISLGNWNMQTPNRGCNIPIPSDIATCKIRKIDAVIFSNGGDMYPFSFPDWTPSGRMHVNFASHCIELERDDGAFFTQSAFYGTSVKRGCASITYSNIKSPSGTTGTVSGLAATCFSVDNSVVTFDGNYPICEYGVVFSQSFNPPTISNGTKVCTVGNIGIGTPYNKSISGLEDNTLTYFRMYAKNCEETGYGVVKSCTTPALAPLTDITFNVNRTDNFGIQTFGTIDLDQSMSTGQWICLSINYNQTANTIGACGRICIFCKPNLGLFFTDISSIIDPSNCLCTNNTQYCGFGGGQFCINKGDCICYQNYSDGNSDSCSSFYILPYSSSVGLTVHQGICNEDSIVNT